MRRFLKITAVVAAVLLAAAVLLPMLLRGKIAEIVKREANAAVTARVDFDRLGISLLRHFPYASLDLKGLTIIGMDRFEGDTLAAVDRISVVVNLSSLFGDGGFEVTKVIVAHPVLRAHRLADGTANWDILIPAETADSTTVADNAEPSAFRLSLREFRISDADIRYADDSTRFVLATAPARLRLRGDLSAGHTSLDLNLGVQGLSLRSDEMTWLSGADAELNASVDADLEQRRFSLLKNTLRLNAVEMTLDGWIQLLENNAVAVDLKAGCGKVQFREVLSLIPAFYTRDFDGLKASGELSLSAWVKGEAQGAELPAFEIAADVRGGSFRYSSLPKSVTDINLKATLSNPGGVMDKTVVDVSEFGFALGRNRVDATLRATALASDPDVRASLHGRLNLGDIAEVYPLDKEISLSGLVTADVKAAGRVSEVERGDYERLQASGAFVVERMLVHRTGLPELEIRRAAATITPAAMTLGELDITLGNSDLTANGQLTGYLGYVMRGSMLSGRLYVKSNLLDLNELIPPSPAPEVAQAETPAAPAANSAIEIPKNLDLSLSADLQKILLGKMTLTGLTGEIRCARGVLSLDGLHLGAFGGNVRASGYYSTVENPQRPALALKAEITGASFARTFAELETVQRLVPLFEKTGGDYSMSLDLATRLDAALSPDLKTLNAAGELRSSNIRLEGIGALGMLSKALGADALPKIDAKNLVVNFTVRDGRIATRPFDLHVGGFDVTLSGSTGLDQTIDYTARVILPGIVTGGVLTTIDVGIGGTFTSPKIMLGAREAVKSAAEALLNDQLKKLTGSENLDAELQKRADQLRDEARRAGEALVKAATEQRQKLIDATKNPLAKLAAEKAGDKLVEEAQRQAAKLTDEAEKQIEKIKSKQP